MKFYFQTLLYSTIIVIACSCKKPYTPPAITNSGSYLVVEGVINSGQDSTIVTLSRTVQLSSTNTVNPVSGAAVAVQSDQNASFPLTETSKGRYVTNALNLDNSRTYRLSIKTADNQQYYSDYVPVLNSPPIDSVFFTTTNNQLNIFSATHDPTNTVKYYRWDYTETWIIHPKYDSGFISNGDTVLTRLPNQQIYTCWQSDTSSTIVLGSSAALSKPVINQNPVTAMAFNSPKIANEYSILLKQYALSADAYNFWVNLKKNTEELGSIFDAQPSQVEGNIHSATNPSEPVIGYVSVGSVSILRKFITIYQLPAWPSNENYPADCLITDCLYSYYAPGSIEPVNQVNEFINYNKGAEYPLIPLAPIQPPGAPKPLGYTASTRECSDCTLKGTNVEPSFWTYYPNSGS